MVTELVGRSREQSLLRYWLDEVDRGQPRVIVLSGAAGIGKTTLIRDLAQGAVRRGLRVATGAAQEGLDVPYLALRSALQAFRPDPATTATAPPIWTASSAGPPVRSTEPVVSYLAEIENVLDIARTSPTVLMIEDVHWADRATIALLRHLVECMNDPAVAPATRLLLAMTTRSTADASSEAAALVDRACREPCTRHLQLAGLDEAGAYRYLERLFGRPPDLAQLKRIVDESGGNPLLLRLLGARTSTDAVGTVTGGDLDRALRSRSASASAACRDLLRIVAVAGDDLTWTELVVITGIDADVLRPLLREATAAALLVEQQGRLTFDHPQLRHVLLADTGDAERRRLHLAIAARLTSDDSPDAILRRADHLVKGSAVCTAEDAETVVWPAAELSYVQSAWAEAARFADAGLDAGLDESDPSERAQRHLLAGTAHFRNHDGPGCSRHYRAAIELARTTDTLDVSGAAALGMGRAELTLGSTTLGQRHDLPETEAFAIAARARAPGLAARALALLGEADFAAFDFDAGLARLAAARELVAARSDDELLCAVDFAEGLQRMSRLELVHAEACFRQSIEHARRCEDRWSEAWGSGRLSFVLHMLGHLHEAETAAAVAVEVATAHHDWAEASLGWAARAALSVSFGRFRDAEDAASVATLNLRRAAYSPAALVAHPTLAAARAHQGDVAGAHAALDDLEDLSGGPAMRYRILVEATTGRRGEAERYLDAAVWRKGISGRASMITVSAAVALAEAGLLLQDDALLETGVVHLREAGDRGAHWCVDWPTSIDRLIAIPAVDAGPDVLAGQRVGLPEGQESTPWSAPGP